MSAKNINLELKVTDNLSGAVDAVLIEQNNILIAKFLKYDFSRFENDGIIERLQDDFFDIKYKTFSVQQLNFNVDWNELIPVVEKIERLRGGGFGMEEADIVAYVTISEEYCEIQTIECIFESEGQTKKEAVYKACVEFIEWYNSKPEFHE